MRKAGYRFREGRTVSELVTHIGANNLRGEEVKQFLMKKGSENFRAVCVSLFLSVIFKSVRGQQCDICLLTALILSFHVSEPSLSQMVYTLTQLKMVGFCEMSVCT
jgi:hypothetical protein